MARIKSALELALERSAEVEADPQRVVHYELRKAGRRLVAEIRGGKEIDIQERFREYTHNELQALHQGVIESLLQYIVLPLNSDDVPKYATAMRCAQAVAPSFKDARRLLGELNRAARQYLEQKQSIVVSLREYFERQLQERVAQLSQNAGINMRIDVSTLPEFQSELRKAMAAHTDRYQPLFDQIRHDVSSALALSSGE